MSYVFHSDETARIITRALDEDLATIGDCTVNALVPADAELIATMTAKEAGVLCGVPLFSIVCDAVATRLSTNTVPVSCYKEDGDAISAGEQVLQARGDARTLLVAERTALNLMQRLSGTASMTAQYVAAVGDNPAKILDTRKTTPGLRSLQKHAVTVGGGQNHRIGLYDQVLIKENHIALMSGDSQAASAVARCRERYGAEVIIEVEIEKLDDLDGVIEAGASIVLLDNMGPDLLAQAVQIRGDRSCLLEASGGITLSTIPAVAVSQVDRISVGALTHSVSALDLSLRCEPVVKA